MQKTRQKVLAGFFYGDGVCCQTKDIKIKPRAPDLP